MHEPRWRIAGLAFVLIAGGIVYLCLVPSRFYWSILAFTLGGGLIYASRRFFENKDAA